MTALAAAILLALLGLLFWGLGWLINQLSSVLLPLAVAGIMAYLLDPLVDYFERRKIARPRAILMVFFLGVMLVLILLATVVPRLVVETDGLIRQVPTFGKELQGKLEEIQFKVEKWMKDPPFGIRLPFLTTNDSTADDLTQPNQSTNIVSIPGSATNAPAAESTTKKPPRFTETTAFRNALEWIESVLPDVGEWAVAQLKKVASWIGLVIGFSLVPVYLFYFLLEKRGIQRKWTDYLPIRDSWVKDELVFVLRSINDYLILFFRGQVLVALCDGLLLTIGFLFIGLNYAFLLGIVAGLLSIVPYLGVLASLIPTLVLAAIQFGDWLHPLLILAIFALVQLAEGLVISPKIMGDRVGLHPLTIIIAVMVGTTLMGGIIGGILAIPLTAALRVVMFRYIWRRPGAAAV